MSFCFCHAFQVIIHYNSLAERFVDAQTQGTVKLWQAGKKNNSPVFGIHFKVEQHLQVIQDSVSDIIRFIYDNDRSLSFLKYGTVDLILNDLEVICFTECRLSTRFGGEVPIKIIYSQSGKIGINHFIKRSIQSRSPVPDSGGLASSGTAGQKSESFRGKQVIQAKQDFFVFLCFYENFF